MLTSDWIRENKKSFAKNFLSNYAPANDHQPTGIFMAGLPGAGKTELSKNLITRLCSNTPRLDMDEIAEQIPNYTPENADDFRIPATTLLNRIYDNIIKNNYNFLLDGTFGSKNSLSNIEHALKHNYRLTIFYIHQDPKTAWNFTKAREIIEHRAITEEGFIDTYFTLLSNLRLILANNYDNLYINVIVKDSNNEILEIQENITLKDIDSLVKKDYNNTTLKQYINEK